MSKLGRLSFLMRLAGGLALLAGAACLVLFSGRHSRATPDGLLPTRFVQTPGLTSSVRFSPDGRLVLTTEGNDAHPLLTFRDAETGSIVRQWPGGRGDQWLSEDGTRMIETEPSEHGPTHCVLRDALSGLSGLPLRRWTGQVKDVRPDFTWMVTADDNTQAGDLPQTGRVADVATGRVLGRFPMPKMGYDSARLSRTGPYLTLSNDDEAAQLMRVPQMTPALTGLPPLQSLRVSRDSTHAFGVDDKGTLHFWSLPSGQHKSLTTGLYRTDWAAELADGDLIVQGAQGSSSDPHGMTQIRSADGMRLLRSLPAGGEAFTLKNGLAIAEGGNRASGNAFEVWDCKTGDRVARLDTNADTLGQPGSRYFPDQGHLDASRDGRHFVLGTGDGLLRFYDLGRTPPPGGPVSTDSGRVLLSFPGSDPSNPTGVTALRGGGVAAAGRGLDGKGEVQIWKPGGDVRAVPAADAAGDGIKLSVSPDGRTLAGSSQSSAWTLPLAGGVIAVGAQAAGSDRAEQPTWPDGPGQPLSVLTEGPYGDGPVVLTRWDTSGLRLSAKTLVPQEQTLGGHVYGMKGAVPSPDGRQIAALWNDQGPRLPPGKPQTVATIAGRLELRDGRTGRLLRTLAETRPEDAYRGASGALDQPVFSPDGTRLAAANDRGIVQVWDTATGHRLGQVSGTQVLNNSTTLVFANLMGGHAALVAFTPDDQGLAVARDDGSVYLYSLHSWLPTAQIGQAKGSLRRMTFSPDGRTLYGTDQNGRDVLAWDVP